MFHPDYVIGAVSLAVIIVLLPVRIRHERAEANEKRERL
jgi:hypothetical protein